MPDENLNINDEINLAELIQTLWDDKRSILISVILAVLAMLGFQFTQPAPNFIATTEIKPISARQLNQYLQSNEMGFFEINKSILITRYIEQLEIGGFIEDAIHTYNLVDPEDFGDEQAYDFEVMELVNKIKINPPTDENTQATGEVRRNWQIQFEFNDKNQWLQALSSIHSNVNSAINEDLRDQFQNQLSSAKLMRNFELEDTRTQIANAMADYDRTTADRLAFLREQASIARELGVAKNTIEAQTFSTQNSVLANVQTDTPFYLRGYEAIEKEIDLISSREDKRAFVAGLFDLQRKLRATEQDEKLERAELLFATTPIMNEDDFSAVTVDVNATRFVSQSKQTLSLALAVILGGFVGVIYVLIASSIRGKTKNSIA